MEQDEKDYVESEDEDFNSDAVEDAEQNLSSSSSDENEAPATGKTKKSARKRKPALVDEGLDSGDEATMQESKRKRRRKDKANDDESEGEGGLIKTRAQRALEKEERKEHRRAHKGGVTVDVDALWTSLSSVPVGRRQCEAPQTEQMDSTTEQNGITHDPKPQDDPKDLARQADDPEYITIKREYEFAGQTVSEEKRVHRDSAEAKLFLSKPNDERPDTLGYKTREDGVKLRRPLKRASMFEPNPTGEVKGLPPHKQRLRTPSRADVLAQQRRAEEESKANGGKAQRLNTVQKSAIDWASHVDAEGLKDELVEYDKSKQGYMSKMDFLQGVQGRRDDDERRARLQKA